jgi:hypothetical protein
VILKPPSDITRSSIKLTWSAATREDFTRYEVHMSTEPGFDLSDKTIIATITDRSNSSITINNLNPSTTYWFRVRSYYEDGKYGDSVQRWATTLEHEPTPTPTPSPTPTPIPPTLAPAPPTSSPTPIPTPTHSPTPTTPPTPTVTPTPQPTTKPTEEIVPTTPYETIPTWLTGAAIAAIIIAIAIGITIYTRRRK